MGVLAVGSIIVWCIIISIPYFVLEEKSMHDKNIGILKWSYVISVVIRIFLVKQDLSTVESIATIVVLTFIITIVIIMVDSMSESSITKGREEYFKIAEEVKCLEKKDQLTKSEESRINYLKKHLKKYEKVYTNKK